MPDHTKAEKEAKAVARLRVLKPELATKKELFSAAAKAVEVKAKVVSTIQGSVNTIQTDTAANLKAVREAANPEIEKFELKIAEEEKNYAAELLKLEEAELEEEELETAKAKLKAESDTVISGLAKTKADLTANLEANLKAIEGGIAPSVKSATERLEVAKAKSNAAKADFDALHAEIESIQKEISELEG